MKTFLGYLAGFMVVVTVNFLFSHLLFKEDVSNSIGASVCGALGGILGLAGLLYFRDRKLRQIH